MSMRKTPGFILPLGGILKFLKGLTTVRMFFLWGIVRPALKRN